MRIILHVVYLLVMWASWPSDGYVTGRNQDETTIETVPGGLVNVTALFPVYVLSVYWPPSYVTNAAQGRTKHIIHSGGANPGFWTHGLWPTKFDGVKYEFCTKEVFDPLTLGVFENSLEYYLRSPSPTVLASKLHAFWSHEWSRHGTCSGLDQLSYFLAVYRASAMVDPYKALLTAGIIPSSTKPYKLSEIKAALSAKYGVAFNPSQSLQCSSLTDLSKNSLAEIRLCLDPATLALADCSKLTSFNSYQAGENYGSAEGLEDIGPVKATSTCGSLPDSPVWIIDYAESDAMLALPWNIILGVGFVVVLLAGAMSVGHHFLQEWRMIPALFVPKAVKTVHYNLVRQPVKVVCEKLDMQWMWQTVPCYAEFVEDLPVGMGIKGGIARKLLKEMVGSPEPPGSFDIDCLLFIDNYTPETRKAAREKVSGMKLGGLVLEAQDVEVLSKEWLTEYWITRDITQNEVLILKVAEGQAIFFYTEAARADAATYLIRPSVHCLKTEFHLVWHCEEDGTPYVASQQVCRSIVRYLKGHGRDYVFDAATWDHYRKQKLSKIELFKVLKPFHDDDQKLQMAVDHLVEIGFLSRTDVRKAGGVNLLWGLLLQEVNATLAKYGGRMTLSELDPEGVERWVDSKKAMVAAKIVSVEMRSRRTGFVPADEGVMDLNLLAIPTELMTYIRSGPTFKFPEEGASASAPASASTSPVKEVKKEKSKKEKEKEKKEKKESVPEPQPPTPEIVRAQWKAIVSGGSTELTNELLAGVGSGSRSNSRHGNPAVFGSPQDRQLAELTSNTKDLNKRQNSAFKEKAIKATEALRPLLNEGQPIKVPECDQLETDDYKLLKFSEAGEYRPMTKHELPGSFYQVIPTGPFAATGGVEEEEYVPLVSDRERPVKERVSVTRLFMFGMGVMAIDKQLLVLSYALLLTALIIKLCLPRVEAALFDSFNELDVTLFKQNLFWWLALVALELAFSLTGRVVVELFTKKAMRTLFRRFFEHVIFQDLPFFSRLSPGELMARTSGDSLTLRSIVSSTTYQILEGVTLLVGSLIFLMASAGPLLLQTPAIIFIFFMMVIMNIVEGWLLGAWLRMLNLMVRQTLGKMFGFTLDTFSKIETVAANNLESRLIMDYRMLSGDYFMNAFLMNVSIQAHNTWTAALSAVLRGSLLYFGGRALFNDLTTVGTLFALLQYCHWLQLGMKQTADAYARLMAGMGSMERLVELHDRGVFGIAPTVVPDDNSVRGDMHGTGDSQGPERPRPSAPTSELGMPLLQHSGEGHHGGPSRAALTRELLALRPDFSMMLGGVRLKEVHLTVRNQTSRLLLHDCSMELPSGGVAVVAGGVEEHESKSALLALFMLRLMPFRGQIFYQLPTNILPPSILANDGQGGVDTIGAPPSDMDQTLVDVPTGSDWGWVSFNFRRDNPRQIRPVVALTSRASCGIFRATIEDNIACAAAGDVTGGDVRRVAKKVGAHESIMLLSEGYGTLAGEGSGTALSPILVLQICMARALMRRPRLLLVDDADAFAEAVGPRGFNEILQELSAGGCSVILNAPTPANYPVAHQVYDMRSGKLELRA